MTVILMPEAEDTAFEIADFVNSVNTDGAGDRWLNTFTQFIKGYAKSNVTYALCNDEVFAKAGLSCINYNGWVIAFKIEDSDFCVYHIARGSMLI